MRKKLLFIALIGGFLLPQPGHSQKKATPTSAAIAVPPVPVYLYQSLRWRNLGPGLGGRCVAVSGVVNQPLVYYMGTAGGGVWKTEDAGWSWRNISDQYFQSASVGAIAVSASDPNVVYAGMGEHAVRGVMTFAGDGVYRSTDAGKTWEPMGLLRTEHIAEIVIHPSNPDWIWVAVQGSLYGPAAERGVYRSKDGGKTWERTLFINNTTGACDLSIDRTNPRVLYAGMWDHQRKPWEIRSGGPGSGLYKSTDGGTSWVKLTQGLPAALGKVAIEASPTQPDRVFALLEAEEGGLYRSEDGGITWARLNTNRVTIARAWYFTKIVADPIQPDVVYILNDPLLKSTDGGLNFRVLPTPHVDQHALWIHPQQPNQLILGNDGGACISLNGGKTWSTQTNQPTGQFYRLAADYQFPYTIYAAQQDQGAWAIPSRTEKSDLLFGDCFRIGDGESAFVALDPNNPQLIFSSNYQGGLTAFHLPSRTKKDVMAFPELGLATLPRDRKYRFNWNAPVLIPPQQPQILYHAANKVLRSTDQGLSWEEISPDLTRNEKVKQGPGGHPFTNEGAGGENYNTISYLASSPHSASELWAGSDDGLLHLTRNQGKSWENITPPDLPEALINCIELSPHHPGQALVVALRQKWQDRRAFVFYTSDFGKTWTKLVNGLSPGDPIHVVREDPLVPGLLYAGSETGFYVSFNQGVQWHRVQANLPYCPITDLLIRNNELIAATGGRGIWILDDLGVFQQHAGVMNAQPLKILTPKPSIRVGSNDADYREGVGANPAPGVLLTYVLARDCDQDLLSLEILDEQGHLIRQYSNQKSTDPAYAGGPNPVLILASKKGLYQFSWDGRRENLPGIPQVFVHGDYRGGLAPPGQYTLRLHCGPDTALAKLQWRPDPRIKATPGEYQEQALIVREMEFQIRDLHLAVIRMRALRDQIQNLIAFLEKQEDCRDLVEAGRQTVEKINAWEKDLIQTAQETPQDAINFPNALNAEMMDLKSRADAPDPRITSGIKLRWVALQKIWVRHKAKMQEIVNQDVAGLNRIFRQKDLPVLLLPPATAF